MTESVENFTRPRVPELTILLINNGSVMTANDLLEKPEIGRDIFRIMSDFGNAKLNEEPKVPTSLSDFPVIVATDTHTYTNGVSTYAVDNHRYYRDIKLDCIQEEGGRSLLHFKTVNRSSGVTMTPYHEDAIGKMEKGLIFSKDDLINFKLHSRLGDPIKKFMGFFSQITVHDFTGTSQYPSKEKLYDLLKNEPGVIFFDKENNLIFQLAKDCLQM